MPTPKPGAGGWPEPVEVKLDDLYQEVILDHNRRPRNYGKLPEANAYSHGVNPLCGDDYHLYLLVDEKGIIQKVRFEGQGCAISKSSASIMTTVVEGKSAGEAETLKEAFIGLLTKEGVSEAERSRAGRLKVFEGVKQFPIRVKCATLAWHALEDALKTK
ncbi:MAG: SUF system NifU family Fe-S cluster assembly protein [Candidatus Omnitrophica bacterium]|nr:SUF system NifU family Fe-S cluster assembly protein [Candidatus Omnitrophota bacterium]